MMYNITPVACLFIGTLLISTTGSESLSVGSYNSPFKRTNAPLKATNSQSSSPADVEHVEEEQEEYDFKKDYTGKKRDLHWRRDQQPVLLKSEINLLKSGVLAHRGEFGRLEDERYAEMQEVCKQHGMTITQGLIVRKQVLVSKEIDSNWRYKKNLNMLKQKFGKQQKTITELSWDMDLPPVGIIRHIIRNRVDEAHPNWYSSDRKKLVKQIISEQDEQVVSNFLTSWETKQLQIAKSTDVVAYQYAPSELHSDLWEQDLYDYLDEQGINYLSETSLRDAGCKLTPDCLFLDDVFINGQQVRWVDCKSFYASGLKQAWQTAKNINRQSAKYEAEYGEAGALIFKHGFSKNLSGKNPGILFLDAGPLSVTQAEELDY